MALADDLDRTAAAAASLGDVVGVLAAEPARGRRRYLVALGPDEERRWVVLDESGRQVVSRADVRETASIVGMCELAADLAGGGDLEELRTRLAQARIVENAPGVEEAEAAAGALERVVGSPPRLASPEYLDAVGAGTAALERALGEAGSPFSAAIRGASGSVDEFVRHVERSYLVGLE